MVRTRTGAARAVGTLAAAALLALAAVGCGSGGDDADDTTTSTTEAATTTTEAAPVDPANLDELPPCADLLAQYAEAFDPTDMDRATALFRAWAPLAPDEVAAALNRLADAYDAVDGDMSKIDLTDEDLTDDARVFSDWTSAGCPAA